jgi:hypothetical protein
MTGAGHLVMSMCLIASASWLGRPIWATSSRRAIIRYPVAVGRNNRSGAATWISVDGDPKATSAELAAQQLQCAKLKPRQCPFLYPMGKQ